MAALPAIVDVNLPRLVTVIIPVYNRTATLLQAIKSVLAQTYQDLEILIVDDGSTLPVAQSLPADLDPRIRCIRLEENAGPARARNVGLQEARGEFVAFLDSDDEWLPHKLERQITALESQAEDFQFDAVATAFYISRTSAASHSSELFVPSSLLAGSGQALWGCNISPGSTLVARRTLFDRVGVFREDLRRLEDWEWLLRIAVTENLLVIREPLAVVHFSAPPNYAQVVAGCEMIKRLQSKRIQAISWLWYLKFRSTLELEKAAAALGSGQLLRAFGWGIACLAFWPFRNMRFWNRVLRRLIIPRPPAGGRLRHTT